MALRQAAMLSLCAAAAVLVTLVPCSLAGRRLEESQPQTGAETELIIQSAPVPDLSASNDSAPSVVGIARIYVPVSPVPGQACTGGYYWPGIRECASAIQYNGGKLQTEAPLTVHLLLYGTWNANGFKDVAIVNNFVLSLSDRTADDLGPSVKKWWDISTKYTDGAGRTVAKRVALGKVFYNTGTYAKFLNDGSDGKTNDILTIVKSYISSGLVPEDSNAQYYVLTSPDVKVGAASTGKGFCDQYCGWHGYSSFASGFPMVYGFVGNPEVQCPSGCGFQFDPSKGSPNGYFGADALINVLAHEITEAATDPYFKGWYTVGGTSWENGDLCNFVFVDAYKYQKLMFYKGINFNMYGANGYRYMVQANADPEYQACVVQADSAE